MQADHALAAFWKGERVAALASLIRSAGGDFDAAEDALAEAAARALDAWRRTGVPDRPGAWMLVTARRVLIDRARASARDTASDDSGDHMHSEMAADAIGAAPSLDDRLALLFTCCHPALSRLAQLGLALRTIGGLSNREIARAFLEPEATTAQRLVRATRKIREAAVPFRTPAAADLPSRMDVAREALYLVFNESYGATEGGTHVRTELGDEAIRLARLLVSASRDDAESLGLLALMLLHHARRHARVDTGQDGGAIIPLEAQDRTRWDAVMIREGEVLLDRALARRQGGPYQLQAAIAALHATATTAADTDWRQIAALYSALRLQMPTPVVELNAAVALAMVHGPEWGLLQLDTLETERGMADYALLHAARADLHRRAGNVSDAAAAYRVAICLTRNDSERRYLEQRLAGLN